LGTVELVNRLVCANGEMQWMLDEMVCD
jgi:hypothetical protein